MTRISKQGRKRAVSSRRPRAPQAKTGPKPNNLPKGYKEHINALDKDFAKLAFIPKLK